MVAGWVGLLYTVNMMVGNDGCYWKGMGRDIIERGRRKYQWKRGRKCWKAREWWGLVGGQEVRKGLKFHLAIWNVLKFHLHIDHILSLSSCYQDKVQRFLNEVRRGNKDYNMMIQNNKEFRNPGIYEKLIDLLQLDEMGTNYPLVRWSNIFKSFFILFYILYLLMIVGICFRLGILSAWYFAFVFITGG